MSEPAKRLPDTNTILRYLIGDEPRLYEKASEFFEGVRVGTNKAVILESVLVECVYVLMKFYKVPKKEIALRLKELLHYKGVANDDRDELIGALNIFADKTTLDIVDCILCAKAGRSNLSIFSFDEALLKYAKNK